MQIEIYTVGRSRTVSGRHPPLLVGDDVVEKDVKAAT